MENAFPSFRLTSVAAWRDLVLPKEHGSWSLALEPLALALLVAPSPAGGWFAAAVVASFFARRPLRIALRETRVDRRSAARTALAGLALVACLAFAMAILTGGGAWIPWLFPAVTAGVVFIVYDLRNDGREEAAEIAGSAAFGLLPAPLAILAGAAPLTAMALAVIMCGRAIPTVLTVRAALRAKKTGVRRPWPALTASVVALLAGAGLAAGGNVPWLAAAALALLALRSFALLVYPRPALRARSIGMIEAVAGVVFVAAVAAAWRA